MRGLVKGIWTASLVTLPALLCGGPAFAADHTDGTATALNVPDASSDLADVYSWMEDADHINLVMTAYPNAVTGSKFSNAVQYVFHTQSKATMLAATSTPMNVVCTFDATQKISCWVVDGTQTVQDYVTGDASATTGIKSADGKMQVFAGIRDDGFFFNLPGFKNVGSVVGTAIVAGPGAGNVITSFDANGCPTVPASTTTAALSGLSSNTAGTGPGVDAFAKGNGTPDQGLSGNIMAIVITLDKSLLSSAAAPIVGVWASTNKAM